MVEKKILKYKIKKSQVKLLIIFLIMIFISFNLKWTGDIKGYKILFENYKDLSPDLGFKVISEVVYKFNGNVKTLSNVYLFLQSIIFILILKMNTKNYFFIFINLLVYPLIFNFIQFRYYLSVLIFIYSLKLFESKKKIMCIGLSFIFHKAVIVLYILYFLINSKLKNIIKIGVIVNVILIAGYELVLIMTHKIFFLKHYSAYFLNTGLSTLGIIYNLIFPFIWVLYLQILFFKYKKNQRTKELENLIKIGTFSVCFFSLGTISSIYSERYIRALHFVIILAIAGLINLEKNKLKRIAWMLITVILSVLNFYWIFFVQSIFGNKINEIQFKLIVKSIISKKIDENQIENFEKLLEKTNLK